MKEPLSEWLLFLCTFEGMKWLLVGSIGVLGCFLYGDLGANQIVVSEKQIIEPRDTIDLDKHSIYEHELDSAAFLKLQEDNWNYKITPKTITDIDSVLHLLKGHIWLSKTDEFYNIDSLYFFNGQKWLTDMSRAISDREFFTAYYPDEELLQYDIAYPQDCFVDMRTGKFNDEQSIGNPNTSIYSAGQTYRIVQYYNGMEMSYYLEGKNTEGMYEHITTIPYPTFRFYWKSDNEVAFKISDAEPVLWEIMVR